MLTKLSAPLIEYLAIAALHLALGWAVAIKAISILSSGGFQCSFQTGDILISVADGNRSQSSSVSCVVTNETGSLVHAEWLPELVVQDGKVSMAVSITQRSRKD